MILPDWPAPANVHACCTTRVGGRSQAPYDSLNLGDHVGDAAQDVVSNRLAFATALGARPVFLAQVHGTHAIELTAATADGRQADGCATAQRGLACTIMAADCLPVLLCDSGGRAVAAAHAGWRGLAGRSVGGNGNGILEATLTQFRALAGIERQQVADRTIAWLGPCIGPDAFEVGAEVKAAFDVHDPQSTACFRPHANGKWLADLQGLARLRLHMLGVMRIYGNDGSAQWCTLHNPSQFFSHRRDRVSGRFAASVWLD